jgi:hypothetical protein
MGECDNVIMGWLLALTEPLETRVNPFWPKLVKQLNSSPGRSLLPITHENYHDEHSKIKPLRIPVPFRVPHKRTN